MPCKPAKEQVKICAADECNDTKLENTKGNVVSCLLFPTFSALQNQGAEASLGQRLTWLSHKLLVIRKAAGLASQYQLIFFLCSPPSLVYGCQLRADTYLFLVCTAPAGRSFGICWQLSDSYGTHVSITNVWKPTTIIMPWIKKVLLCKSFDLDLRDNFSLKHADKHLTNCVTTQNWSHIKIFH